MMKDFKQFMDNINKLIEEKISSFLKEQNVYVSHSGIVLDVKDDIRDKENCYRQICGVDLVYTSIKDVLNKSGQPLQPGDSVVVFEKYGSNYANCFIAYKTGE